MQRRVPSTPNGGFSIRNSLFQLCCSGRASTTAVQGGQVINIVGAARVRKLSGTFGKEPNTVCIEYKAGGHDSDKFDEAFEARDFASLVNLVQSTHPIESFHSPKHPWAEDPKTVGALTMVVITLLSQSEAPETNTRFSEAIPPLVESLRSSGDDQDDRVQAAIVALRALTEDCTPNACVAFDAGALSTLVPLLDSPVAGMRVAVASTARNICMGREEYCSCFIALGGMKGLVNQLDIPFDPVLDHPGFIHEAIWNLEDMITDPDLKAHMVEHIAKMAIQNGAIEKLEKLRKNPSGDKELGDCAESVLSILAKIK